MPPIVAAAAITGGAALFGGAMQSRSAGNAARQQTQSANESARIQAETARFVAEQERLSQAEVLAQQERARVEALEQQRREIENAFANSESARRGNYDQWAAREGRLGSIGAALGYGTRTIPGYVPGVAPTFGAPGTGGPSGPTGPMVGGGPGSVGDALERPPQTRQTPPEMPRASTMPVRYASMAPQTAPLQMPTIDDVLRRRTSMGRA